MAARPSFTHAGGIVVRTTPEGERYLIVRSLKNADLWVLPKGHIDPGETPEAAAVREVREEAGVKVELGRFVGASEFVAGGERCRVALWRMVWRADVAPLEARPIAWLPLDQALARLSFPDTRELVRRAAE